MAQQYIQTDETTASCRYEEDLRMKNIIIELIEYAKRTHDYEIAERANDILSEFSETCNCPSNWRSLGKELAEKYKDNEWIMESCRLYDFD